MIQNKYLLTCISWFLDSIRIPKYQR